MAAADILKNRGYHADVIKLGILKPNSFSETLSSLKRTGILLTAEEVCSASCIGGLILEAAEKSNVLIRGSILLNLGDGIVPHGDSAELRTKYRLDSLSIADEAMKLLRNNE